MTAADAVEQFLVAVEALDDDAVFIAVADPADLRTLAADIDTRPAADVPLRGLVFAAKDNIDVVGMATTAGCPSFAYDPTESATVVARLVALGAVPVAKTNLDQFATGLVGVRSPYGTPTNPCDATLVPGGSSSGSAVAVACGLVDFALGTDTAGSGRVPAAFCGIVGLKPTVGRIPCGGVVPAVRSVDVVSVFARTTALAHQVTELVSGPDGRDPLSREAPAITDNSSVRRLGVLDAAALATAGASADAIAHYEEAVTTLSGAGLSPVPIDITDWFGAGDLLYGGPFVAERTAAVGDFLASEPLDADPTVAAIINGGARHSAVDAYRASYAMAEYQRSAEQLFDAVDVVMLPTIPRAVTLADIAADPVGPNTDLGRFTTFANLLDLSGLTVPLRLNASTPFDPTASISFYGPAWREDHLISVADALHGTTSLPARPEPAPDSIRLVVAGAHLKGQPLEHQLVDLGARWNSTATTAPCYRMFALPGGPPHKPALIHDPAGAAIEVDIWELSPAALGSFLTMVPAPLALGTIELADGSTATGFVAESRATIGATEITSTGGWRAYLQATLDR